MQTETMTFVGAAGSRLAGLIRRPGGPVVGSAVFARCFTCGKDLHTLSRLARRLTEAGWLTLTFDFTGIGGSEGDFVDTTVSSEVGDTVVGADQTERLVTAARDGSLVTIPDADHLFSHPKQATALAQEVIAWLNTQRRS